MVSAKIRPDFVPVEDYISKEFLQLENERMWPNVWLITPIRAGAT